MRRSARVLMLLALIAAVGLTAARAQDDAVKLKGGVYERIRHEYWKNNQDMEDTYYGGGDRNFFRFKTSLWGQVDYEETFSLFGKLTNEIKSYNLLGSGGRKVYYSDHRHWDPDETIFDNLYVDVKRPADIPVSFRIGRQDLLNQYGENFLICDGTPGDGSRTFYFNALKASWTMDNENTLDMMYMKTPRDDQWLPVINEDKSPVALTTTAEEGFAFYWKNKSVKDLALEPYFMYKHEDDDYGSGYQSKSSKIRTVGAFSKYSIAPWTLHGQLAHQSGEYGDDDRQAVGGYLFADFDLNKSEMKPVLSAGYVYLSGNKQRTPKQEGWNPLWCRFPIYSELYAQSFQYESGNSYWTNLSMYRIGVTLIPFKQAKFNMNYSFLRANELVAANATGNLSGTGKNRGHLIIGKLDYTFNKNVASYLLGEYFIPSDGSNGFYTDAADPAIFIRTQLELKF